MTERPVDVGSLSTDVSKVYTSIHQAFCFNAAIAQNLKNGIFEVPTGPHTRQGANADPMVDVMSQGVSGAQM